MSFYHWLGIDAEDIDMTEDDGFITVSPNVRFPRWLPRSFFAADLTDK